MLVTPASGALALSKTLPRTIAARSGAMVPGATPDWMVAVALVERRALP